MDILKLWQKYEVKRKDINLSNKQVFIETLSPVQAEIDEWKKKTGNCAEELSKAQAEIDELVKALNLFYDDYPIIRPLVDKYNKGE